MTEYKEIELHRAPGKTPGSFGFSIMGGASAKLPAVVCEMEPGGPAVESGNINIGDQLIKLNGEDLSSLGPKELVMRIRMAPSPSIFTLVEDDILRDKVLEVLRRQEEKKRERREKKICSTSSDISMKSVSRGSPSHSREPRKILSQQHLPPSKELEIETSVNMTEGPGVGEVVRARKSRGMVGEIPSDGPDNSVIVSPQHVSVSSLSLEQRSMMSSNSSGSLGNEAKEEGVVTTSEVTPSGTVFLIKQLSQDGESPRTSSQKSSPNVTRGVSTAASIGMARNGDIRTSLHEETFVNEINLSQERNQGATPIIEEYQKEDTQLRRVLSPPKKSKYGSPPVSQELIEKYSPSKNKKDDPYVQAITLARKLYMLDGYKKSEVTAKLADRSEFGMVVAREYLRFYEFEGESLDNCLRQFLASIILAGETHERERVLIHFSKRYFECNPYAYPSYDAVHGLTCALLLLNSDLHSDHGGHKMSFSQFVSNLERIGVQLPKDSLKKMYESIKRKPLESGLDDVNDQPLSDEESDRVYHVLIPGTFVEVELPEKAPVFKEGYVKKKNVMDAPHKKVPRGKRQWKPYYAYLKGFLLYLIPKKAQLNLQDTSNAMVITHCLAMRAPDYHKRDAVLRVTTSDWHSFLLQVNGYTDVQEWMVAINRAAAMFSAPPLAAPIGSGVGFQRPTFPLAPTRNTIEQQSESHQARIKSLEKQLEEHQEYKSNATKRKKVSEWFEKREFLQFEINRFHIYNASLYSSDIIDFDGPLPTGLVPSPSVNTLATPGMTDELMSRDLRRISRDSSPLPLLRGSHDRRKDSSPINFSIREPLDTER